MSEMERQIRQIVEEAFRGPREELVNQLVELLRTNTEPRCVGCQKTISGISYTCTECPDYVLCNCCEEEIAHPHDLLKKRHVNQSYEKVVKGGQELAYGPVMYGERPINAPVVYGERPINGPVVPRPFYGPGVTVGRPINGPDVPRPFYGPGVTEGRPTIPPRDS